MAFSKELLKGSIELVLLQTVQDLGEGYGYQLLATIEKSSGSIFQFQESTLYPLLYRLEEKGFLRSEWKKNATKERRYYSLTPKGEKALLAETLEFKQFLKGMYKVLKLEGNA